MSSQPANSTISVDRRLRVFRGNERHTSIKHLTTPFNQALVAVPGEEIQVVETRDNVVTDAFRFGHPIVVEARAACSVADIYDNVTGMDFPVRLTGNPREMALQKAAANRTDDLYGDAQTACPGDAFTA